MVSHVFGTPEDAAGRGGELFVGAAVGEHDYLVIEPGALRAAEEVRVAMGDDESGKVGKKGGGGAGEWSEGGAKEGPEGGGGH